MSFVDVFLQNLEAHPDRAFVTEVHGERMVPTRGGRLREMIEQARRWLRSGGVREGDRVVLVASNSARWVALDLAIAAEGATSVPLYARQAPAELAAMMRDCDPRVIVVGTPPSTTRWRRSRRSIRSLATSPATRYCRPSPAVWRAAYAPWTPFPVTAARSLQ